MTYGFLFNSTNFSYNPGVFRSYAPMYSYVKSFGLSSFAPSGSNGPSKYYGTGEYYGPREHSYSDAPAVKPRPSTKLYAPRKSQETALFTERTVTPRGGCKYKRPRFKTQEAARLWNGFSAKASAFNPQTDLGPEFLNKVKEIAGEIGCEYRDLLSLMQIESGLNPYMPNRAGYGAYGLIQFQPSTLRSLGYQPEDLLRMSPVEQLGIVKKHLLTAKKSKRLNGKLNAGQLYGLVLAPGYVNNSYFYAEGSKGYGANANLDKIYGNNNGKIEKSDLAACIRSNRVSENIFVA